MSITANSGGFQDVFASLKSLARRKVVQAEASLWKKIGENADRVDRVAVKPLVAAREKVVGGVQAVGQTVAAVASPFNIKLALIIVALLAVGWVIMQTRALAGK